MLMISIERLMCCLV